MFSDGSDAREEKFNGSGENCSCPVLEMVGRDGVCALMEDLTLVRGTNSSYTVKGGEVEYRQTQVGE